MAKQKMHSSLNRFPSIKLEGFEGRAEVLAFLVEHREPYRMHPNQIVGRDGNFFNVLPKTYNAATTKPENQTRVKNRDKRQAALKLC